MTIGTLVVIVLAIIVLVVLVLGFTTGWSALWAKINPFIGGSSGGVNVDSVRQACELLCGSASVSPSSKIEYCNNIQTVVYEKGKTYKETCKVLESKKDIGLKVCDISCTK